MSHKRINNLMFIKLILFFFLVLVISFSAVLIFSDEYLNQKALSSIESYTIQALGSMEGYVNEKYVTAKRMIAALYNNSYFKTIPTCMPHVSSHSYKETLVFNDAVDSFLQYGFSSDYDITNIALKNYSDDSFIYRRKGASTGKKLELALKEQVELYSDSLNNYGFDIFPVYINENTPYNGYLLPMLCYVKSSDMISNVGCLLIDFSTNNMMSLLDSYISDYPNSIAYVVDESGNVIFDSTYELIGQKYSDMKFIKTTSSNQGSIYDNRLYINSTYSNKLGLYFIATTSINDIYNPLISQKKIIRIGIALLSLTCLLSSILFASRYFRRINILCNAIKRIQSGDFKVRVPEGESNDELSLISRNLNEMCHMLEDYIQKVYITQIESQSNEILRKDAQLKQRTAELYALQTQINPHFLYNTLESIRMRALSSGNQDVAKMSFILSSLFKYSLKPDIVTSIADEIDIIRLYLELTCLRYPDTFHIIYDIEEATYELGIIRHILQPIIENIMNHGVDINKKQICIEIHIHQMKHNIEIQVKDNGKGIASDVLNEIFNSIDSPISSKSASIGLANVHQRILRIFGKPYGIHLDSEPGQGTLVTIQFPAMSIKEMNEYVQCLNR